MVVGLLWLSDNTFAEVLAQQFPRVVSNGGIGGPKDDAGNKNNRQNNGEGNGCV